jgi:hypothetical protein
LDDCHLTDLLEEYFNSAHRLNPSGRHYERRLKRHGKDTLYFISQPFVFVVQNATIITVELGTRDTRQMNHRNGRAPLVNPTAVKDVITAPKAPRPPTVFRIRAHGYDNHGVLGEAKLGFWNITDQESTAPLKTDHSFQRIIMARFAKNRPNWTLKSISASYGQEGDFDIVFDNGM